jgi:hypothetical protein
MERPSCSIRVTATAHPLATDAHPRPRRPALGELVEKQHASGGSTRRIYPDACTSTTSDKRGTSDQIPAAWDAS